MRQLLRTIDAVEASDGDDAADYIGGLLHGFQIWLNLPSAEKMQPAAYQNIRSTDIPELNVKGSAKVGVIAGQVDVGDRHLTAPLSERSTRPTLLDVELRPCANLELRFDEYHGALVYVYHGSISNVQARQLGVFSKGKTLALSAGESGSRLLVMNGHSIGEPIVQHGPFVMNSAVQIEQAFKDYQNDQFV